MLWLLILIQKGRKIIHSLDDTCQGLLFWIYEFLPLLVRIHPNVINNIPNQKSSNGMRTDEALRYM